MICVDVARAVLAPEEPVVAVSVEDVELGEVDFAEIPGEAEGAGAAARCDDSDIVEGVGGFAGLAEDGDAVAAPDECVGQKMDLIADADFRAGGEIEAGEGDVQAAPVIGALGETAGATCRRAARHSRMA